MKFKRFLAATLSALMLISAMSFTAIADEAEATLASATKTADITLAPSAAPKAFGGALVKAGSAASTPAKASAALAAEEAELAADASDEYYTVAELEAKYPGYQIVYVRPAALQSGETQGTGATYDNPYLGIGSGDTGAFKAHTPNNAKVVFALTEDWTHGAADLQLNSNASSGCDVIITSAKKTLVKYHNNDLKVLAFGNHGSVTFDNIIMSYNFTSNGQTATIRARGWDIKITDTVQLVKSGSYTGTGAGLQLVVGGNWETAAPADGDVVFDISGVSVNTITTGSSNGSRVNGNIKYVWNSEAGVENVYLAGHTTGGDNSVRTINGDITLEINKGLVRNVYESRIAYINGNVTLNLNGGTLGNLRVYSLNAASVMCGSWVVNWHGGDWWSLSNDNTPNVTSKNRILVANTDNTDTDIKAKLDTFKTKTVSESDTTKLFTSVITYNGNKGKASVRFDAGDAYTFPSGVAHTYIGGSGPAFHNRTQPKLVLTRADSTVENVCVNNTVYEFENGDTVTVPLTLNADQTLESAEIEVIFGNVVTATFKEYEQDGAVADKETVLYGVEGVELEAPAVSDNKTAHKVFKGWVIEGTTELVDPAFGTESVVYVAIFEDEPTYDIKVDGDLVKTAYKGDEYTLPLLENTETERFIGWATTYGASEAEFFADEKITVEDADIDLYSVWKTKDQKDAEYTFNGRYDFSEGAYVVDMYYNGPLANVAAFGIAYDTEIFTSFEVEYTDEVQSTGTIGWTGGEKTDEAGTYVDAVYAKDGAVFGDAEKAPVKIATITAALAPEKYADFNAETALIKYFAAEAIPTAFDGREWLYIMDADNSANSTIYPIYFTELVNNDAVEVTYEGKKDSTVFTLTSTDNKMNKDITFTITDEASFDISYEVDGVRIGALVANEGTYTIPAENVLGNINIVFKYGQKIESVNVTGITAPAYNQEPDTEADEPADGANFTVKNIKWTYLDGEDTKELDGKFDFDTAYTVEITLEPKDSNYIFAADTEYKLDGNEVTVVSNEDGTVTFKYTYEATEKELGAVAVTVNLIREETDAAYKNFAKVEFVSKSTGLVVEEATVTETGDAAGASFVAEASLLAGEYTVRVSKNGYLTSVAEVEIEYQDEEVLEITLTAGNLYDTEGADDHIINSDDFARVTKAFTAEADLTGDALTEYRELVDIDEDGFVTVFDLVEVKANFGSEGALYNE